MLTTGLGKIPLWKEQVFEREGVLWVRNYRGDEAPVTDGGEPERE